MPKPFAKFGNKKRAEYLKHLGNGVRRFAAAEAVGISRELIRLYRHQHPEFATEEETAEMQANELVEDALFQAARDGNVVACQVWLYNRSPDRWQDKRRLEHQLDGSVQLVLVEEIVDAPSRKDGPPA